MTPDYSQLNQHVLLIYEHRGNDHQRQYRICAVFATKTVKRRRTVLTCTASSMPRIETIIYGPRRRHRQSIRLSPFMYVYFPVLRRDFTVFREGTDTFTVIELRLCGNDGVRRSPSLTRIIATGRIRSRLPFFESRLRERFFFKLVTHNVQMKQ